MHCCREICLPTNAGVRDEVTFVEHGILGCDFVFSRHCFDRISLAWTEKCFEHMKAKEIPQHERGHGNRQQCVVLCLGIFSILENNILTPHQITTLPHAVALARRLLLNSLLAVLL